MSAPGAVGIPASVIDDAIGWAVKLDFSTPVPETRQAFDRWLNAQPAHAAAWQRVQSLKNDFAQIPPRLALDALTTAEARRRAGGLSRRQAVRLLSLAGVAVAAGWVASDQAPWQRLLADYSTATGEQRTVRLDDGTVIVLNTDSAISTALEAGRRLVVLRRGEILVTTGADAGSPRKRPFWVHTPFGTAQALGTRFVVRLAPGRARVSVQEDAVEIHPLRPAAGSRPVIVRAGESWWLAPDGVAAAQPLGFEPDGWADGVIAGQNIRLADLLDELSRYRPGRIVCDERVAELRVSGVYHLRDTDRALRFLVQTQPVSVALRTRFWVSVGPEAMP
jgi:transmembrane sensor